MSGPYTNKVVVGIDASHSAIHDGKMFTAGVRVTLDASEKLQLLVSPPAGKFPHITIKAVSELIANFDVIHDVTSPVGGTSTPIVNRVVGSSNVPGTVLKSAVTGALITYSGGTLVPGLLTSGGRNAGGSDSFNLEWVVKAGHHLLFEVTSSGNNNDIALDVDFYEY